VNKNGGYPPTGPELFGIRKKSSLEVCNMPREMNEPHSIDLTFWMESSASLWNVIFEGFDQEVVLVSRFSGNDSSATNTLYKFGNIIGKQYKDCCVKTTGTGIEIKKYLPKNDSSLVNEWTGLMENIREEITKFLPVSPVSSIK
jgi:hypothetical protein